MKELPISKMRHAQILLLEGSGFLANEHSFYVRVFNPMARRYGSQEFTKAQEINEREKKRQYNKRILAVVHGSSTMLVKTALNDMGWKTSKFYFRLSESIAKKRKERYSVIKKLISRKIFALLNCICLCVRRSRSRYPLRGTERMIPVPVKCKHICHERQNYTCYVNCNFSMSKSVYKYLNS